MKYIKKLISITIVLCTIFTANIYAQNATADDGLVTCNIDGTETGKGQPLTKATITLSDVDNSGNYIYKGIILGVFKKSTSTWDLVPELEQSILTDSLKIEVTNFGDMTKYEYNSVYALGYKVLYEPTGNQQPIGSTDWYPINGSFFKVKGGIGNLATITSVSITKAGEGNKDLNIDGTGTNIAQAKYRIYYSTSNTLPSLDRTPNADNPGSGWTDSDIVNDMTINSPTSMSALVSASNYQPTWKYVLFKVAVTSDSSGVEGWSWEYTDAYDIKGDVIVVPPDQPAQAAGITTITITPPSIPSGQTGYGKPVKINATGTSIKYAKYRIFWSEKDTAPYVTNTSGANNPGTDWNDSGIVEDMTINSSTNTSATVPGKHLSNTSWKYVVFKVAVSSDQNKWTWKYSSVYRIFDGEVITPETPPSSEGSGGQNAIPTPFYYYGDVSIVSGYINYIGHNQVIDIDGTKKIIVTTPDTPDTKYGPCTLQDISNLQSANKFTDKSYLKYRLEFDILNADKANEIKDMYIFLNLNTLAEENIQLDILGARLVSRNNNGTVEILKELSCVKEAGSNRYSIALGDDNSGTSIIVANGFRKKFAIEYDLYMRVGIDYEGDTLSQIRNEAQLIMNIGDSIRGVEALRANQKHYIDTKVWRGSVKLG